jgi:hypothetical protein
MAGDHRRQPVRVALAVGHRPTLQLQQLQAQPHQLPAHQGIGRDGIHGHSRGTVRERATLA